MLLAFRRSDVARGIRFDDSFAHQVLEERPHRRQMPRRRRARQFASRKMRKIRADRKMIDALQVELIAPEREVVVAEKSDERFEVISIRGDGVDGDVPLVSEVIEKLA